MKITKNNIIRLTVFVIGWVVITYMLKVILLLIASLINFLAFPLAITFAFILMLIIFHYSTR